MPMPSKLTVARRTRILEIVRAGGSLREAARAVGSTTRPCSAGSEGPDRPSRRPLAPVLPRGGGGQGWRSELLRSATSSTGGRGDPALAWKFIDALSGGRTRPRARRRPHPWRSRSSCPPATPWYKAHYKSRTRRRSVSATGRRRSDGSPVPDRRRGTQRHHHGRLRRRDQREAGRSEHQGHGCSRGQAPLSRWTHGRGRAGGAAELHGDRARAGRDEDQGRAPSRGKGQGRRPGRHHGSYRKNSLSRSSTDNGWHRCSTEGRSR